MNKNILKRLNIGSKVHLIEKGFCPFCKRRIDANRFRDKKSKKEFNISGLCQDCQDGTFGR